MLVYVCFYRRVRVHVRVSVCGISVVSKKKGFAVDTLDWQLGFGTKSSLHF